MKNVKHPIFNSEQRIGFTGNLIDRQAEARTDDCVEKALADARSRIVLVKDGRALLLQTDSGFELWQDLQLAQSSGADLEQAVLLGCRDGVMRLAAPVADVQRRSARSMKAIDYRSVYVQGLLSREDEGALSQAAALIAWQANHLYCGRCGTRTQARAGGYKRFCAGCETEHHPRTDPVVIMMSVKDDRCLLGRSKHFPPGMYSCLAGFVEPGETIEDAVRRETFEEAGIRTGQVSYHASQPWPFPYSLMIGCYAEAQTESIVMDAEELEDCRWFSRRQLQGLMEAQPEDSMFVPPRGAIAHRLMSDWLDAE